MYDTVGSSLLYCAALGVSWMEEAGDGHQEIDIPLGFANLRARKVVPPLKAQTRVIVAVRVLLCLCVTILWFLLLTCASFHVVLNLLEDMKGEES